MMMIKLLLFLVESLWHISEPAYTINIHQAQCMPLNSYFLSSDYNFFLTGNVAYTTISRLKQKLNFNLERELAIAKELELFN